MARLTHVAALALVLALSACGGKSSRQDLEAKIAELEDENDLLKQQLADARLQAEEAMVAAERARTPMAAAPPMIPLAPEVPADLLVDRGHDDPETSDPAPRRPAGAGSSASAGSAAAAAAEAAETARRALAN